LVTPNAVISAESRLNNDLSSVKCLYFARRFVEWFVRSLCELLGNFLICIGFEIWEVYQL